jgi:hypothetical protein
LALGLGLSVAFACHSETHAFHPVANESPERCESRQKDFSAFLAKLPDRAVRIDVKTELPVSTLGVPPGAGSVLEMSEAALRLDGETLDRKILAERLATRSGTLYVAAPSDTTVAFLRSVLEVVPKTLEPRLLVRTERSAGAFLAASGASARSRELAEELIAERDPNERRAIAKRAYAELSSCDAVGKAAQSVEGLGAGDRFAALKKALSEAVPACPCSSLDTAGLGALLLAESRAGTASLGALPLAFARDERCSATMALRSVKKLLEQIEEFDADYAGRYGDDAIRFETIVTNDRLLVQFCDALPGETLAAREKARASVWVRLSSGACEAWKFEPLSPGAPMGTLRRTAPGASALAFHYWQAAEEITLFGPVSPDAPTKPTDQREWPCRVSYKMSSIEPEFVSFETGRWFFSEPACKAAPAEAAPGGCVAELSAGVP